MTTQRVETVAVRTPSAAYSVRLGHQALDSLLAPLAGLEGVTGVWVFTDQHVAALHLSEVLRALDRVGRPAGVWAFPPGEDSKSLDRAREAYEVLDTGEADRGALLIALGGGVVGDLTGFVAATWLRGVRWAYLPTTLEAAVDASIGGKTGVNFRAGKNRIGAFHHPVLVAVETAFLATLPQRDRRAGLAESIKHALIADGQFLRWQEERAEGLAALDGDELVHLIARNAGIKAAVVSEDEREETGRRAVLNFGHTIGHAIESVSTWSLRHGECVGLGMIAACRAGAVLGVTPPALEQRVRDLLARVGLPVNLPAAAGSEAIEEFLRRDKKRRGGRLAMVLLRDVARPEIRTDVPDEAVTAAVAAIQPSTR